MINQTVDRGVSIRNFRVGDTIYEHRIFTQSDDRVECRDSSDKLLYTYTARTDVLDAENNVIGRIRLVDYEKGEWNYKSLDGNIDITQSSKSAEVILDLEVIVSKTLIGNMLNERKLKSCRNLFIWLA